MAELFRENGIDYDKVNYFNEPFTEQNLGKLFAKMGIRPFDGIRKGEADVKEGRITSETPDSDVIGAMVENPNLLQRPIVEVGDRAVLARPIERALELIGQR